MKTAPLLAIIDTIPDLMEMLALAAEDRGYRPDGSLAGEAAEPA